jgi:polyvinyl alcohol dehydrogenase (cytochrome)
MTLADFVSHTAQKLMASGLWVCVLCASACSSDSGSDDDGPSDPGTPVFSDWASYGRDNQNTRANLNERWISVSNVATLEPKWSFSAAAVTGTPTLFDGILYFGDWASDLHAVDAVTGQERWVADLQDDTTPNQINHTPYVTADTVYVGAHAAELFAVDRATGTQRWKSVIDDQTSLMLWSSPVLIDDLIVIGVGSYQVFIPAEPPFRGNVVGVDAGTGEVRWRLTLTEGSGVSVWSSAAIDTERKLMFIGTGQEYADGAASDNSDSLIAVRYETGELAWTRQFTAGDRFQSGRANGPDFDVGASPNLFEAGGQALAGVGDKAGRYHAVDRDSGEVVWTRELTPGGRTGGVMASTAYADGVIFVVSNNGMSGGGAGTSGPGEATVFALDAGSGDVRWQVTHTPGTFGALAVANGILFVPTLGGELRAFDARDGAPVWTAALGATMAGGVTVSGAMVFAGHGWTWIPSGVTPGGLTAYGLP